MAKKKSKPKKKKSLSRKKKKKSAKKKSVRRAREGAKKKARRTGRPRQTGTAEFKAAIQSIRARAEDDAEIFVSFAKRAGTDLPDDLLQRIKEKCTALLDASKKDDADYGKTLPGIAIELALDPTGGRGIDPADWVAAVRDDGEIFIRRSLFPLPPIGDAIHIKQPRIAEILRAVFSRPRDLPLLRLAAGEILQIRNETVTLRNFLLSKGVPETRVSATKNNWRQTKTKGGALPPPVKKGPSGKPHHYDRILLNESWRNLRGNIRD